MKFTHGRCDFRCLLTIFALFIPPIVPQTSFAQSDGSEDREREDENRREDEDRREANFRNNRLLSTTIQLPTLGVSIDAKGVLTARAFQDKRGDLIRKRLQLAEQIFRGDLRNVVGMRKISLRRLQIAIQKRIAQGQEPSDEMKNLVGLTRAEYVFLLPEQNDIVIAGPAEPWIQNASGRVVGIDSGKPILLLDDLLAAMRAFGPKQKLETWVACSIDPTAEGIERLKEFQKKIPHRVAPHERAAAANQLGKGLQQSLGNADIKVYGVPRQTHLAQVMIEADYRMKMMAVGLEPPPIRMTTFIAALRGAPKNMQRWWFQPNYKCIMEADDGTGMRLVGKGVILSTQNIDFDKRARIVATGNKSSSAAKRYASSFTSKYAKISEVRPIYAQLRNVVDLLVLAAWIKKQDGFAKVGWTPDTLLDEKQIPIQNVPNPKQCPCVANAVWKGNLLVLPAGGGVSISAVRALTPANLIDDTKGQVDQARKNLKLFQREEWWWD